MNFKRCFGFVLVISSSASYATGTIDWAHLNGSIQNNGAITIKSVSTGSYSGLRNPTGVNVKNTQPNVTQPPTVMITTTSAPNRWSMYYKDRALGLP